jgi:hypothetical protein
MRFGWVPVVAVTPLLLGGCGTATSGPRANDVPAERPTAVPAADGQVRTTYGAMVLDDGDGTRLCLGGVADSYPPQCSGVPLEGWSWEGLPADFDNASGVRFGVYVVTGTFDGTTLTVTGVAGPDAADPVPDQPDPFVSPCPAPDDGWHVLDPALTTERALGKTIDAAERRDDFAAAWVDQSINPVYPETQDGEPGIEVETRMNDPKFTIINIQVTGDVADAEAQARKTWGGSLCVSKGTSTLAERLRIQQELGDIPGSLGSSGDGFGNVVELDVVIDDGSLQRWADATYGDGLVKVSSALRPVDP